MSCTKMTHASQSAANKHVRWLERQGKGRNRAYVCPDCGRWHVGYRRVSEGDRITELLRRREEKPSPY